MVDASSHLLIDTLLNNSAGLIKQFLRDVDWGKLDYMIVDTPPGTSDEHLTISKYLKDSNTFAVIITTPQELSLQDVRKEISFCRKIGIPIIGIVENMSIFICPNCNYASEIFDHKTGGAEKMCKDLSLPFLGSVPLEPEVARSCDEGEQYTDFFPETLAYKEYLKIAEGNVRPPASSSSAKTPSHLAKRSGAHSTSFSDRAMYEGRANRNKANVIPGAPSLTLP